MEEARIFRPADYAAITDDNNALMKKIIDRARKVENSIVEPTLSDRSKMMAILVDYIKKKGRIIYGGFAINALILAKDKRDAFYDFDFESPDIEFYSSDAAVDVKELCDLFHEKGYKYIRGTEAFHAETYKVSVNLVQICDVTYVPKNIQRAIPYLTIDGAKIAHPHFLLIDSLRILTDPMTSYWRLDKAFPRMYALQKHYPLLKPNGHEINLSRRVEGPSLIEDAIAFLKTGLDDDEVSIMVGYAAFDRLSAWSGSAKEHKRLPFLEVVLSNYEKTMKKLFGHLSSKNATIKYEEFQRFFDYCGRRGQISIGGVPFVIAYHNNHRCTPILPLAEDESKSLRTATLSTTALYLLVHKMLCRTVIPPNLQGQNVCESLVYELYAMRARFLQSLQSQQSLQSLQSTVVTDAHRFQELSTLCAGPHVSTLRLHKEETEYRKAHLNMFGTAYFVYEPNSFKKSDPADYKYMNSSGNPIRTSDRLFTPGEGFLVEYADEEPVEGPRHRHHNSNRKSNRKSGNRKSNRKSGQKSNRKSGQKKRSNNKKRHQKKSIVSRSDKA